MRRVVSCTSGWRGPVEICSAAGGSDAGVGWEATTAALVLDWLASGSKKNEGAGEPVGDGKGDGGAAALVVEPEGPLI